MNIKKLSVIATIAICICLISIAITSGKPDNENLETMWDGTNIISEVSNFHEGGCNYLCYQLRYYPSSVINNLDDIENEIKSISEDEYETGAVFYGNPALYDNGIYKEEFSASHPDWIVVLMKGGNCDTSDCNELNSYRAYAVPEPEPTTEIPEFPVIAIPVVIIMGIMLLVTRIKK